MNMDAWFVLPHFPVVRHDKITTKVRIEYDCAARSNGIALNYLIYSGPNLQQDLFNVLIRFRRKPVAIVCDILFVKVNIHG
jgi:hypothetical protein